MTVIAHRNSSGVRAAREKLLAVPRPIAGMRSPVDGIAFMLCNLTATQSKTYVGGVSRLRWSPIKKAIEGGRHSLPHRGHETAEVAPALDNWFEDRTAKVCNNANVAAIGDPQPAWWKGSPNGKPGNLSVSLKRAVAFHSSEIRSQMAVGWV